MVKMIITLKRREGMGLQEFIDYRRDVHAPLLFAIPEAKRYIRRFVVSHPVPAPGFPESSYDAVIEAWFDSMDDLEGLFFSENFRTKCPFENAASARHMVAARLRPAPHLVWRSISQTGTKVDPDHVNFIDLSKVGRIISEETVIVG